MINSSLPLKHTKNTPAVMDVFDFTVTFNYKVHSWNVAEPYLKVQRQHEPSAWQKDTERATGHESRAFLWATCEIEWHI